MTESLNTQTRDRDEARHRALLARRMRSEARFRWLGRLAIASALLFLVFLLFSIVSKGWSAFLATEIRLDIPFQTQWSAPDQDKVNYRKVVGEALQARFPEATSRQDRRALTRLLSKEAPHTVADLAQSHPEWGGITVPVWFLASGSVDVFNKGTRGDPTLAHLLTADQKVWFSTLEAQGDVRLVFNSRFLTSGDSREPELAGIWGAIVGSFFTLGVTLLLSFPIGVTAAFYLEELAPRNRLTDIIEININNLAAVPSIVFGLLGLAVFLNFMDMPRSAPLVGGMVLALMTLPTIIIATRASLRAVPPSIREAALGMGASPLQVVTHHVLPLAMPGILTGTIVGLSQALGETAPLLMIGMVAFIVDIPASPLDPSTVLPVQIFLWADSPERGFVEKVGGATIVLLLFLVVMNGLAVYLRNKFERRW